MGTQATNGREQFNGMQSNERMIVGLIFDTYNTLQTGTM